MRVLVVSHTAQVGGAETALLRLCAAVDPSRVHVTILLLAHGPLEDRCAAAHLEVDVLDIGALTAVTRAETTSLRRLVTAPASLASAARALRAWLSDHPHDLVVANTLKAAVLTHAALGRREPWVWQLHDRLAPDYLPAATVAMMRLLAAIGPARVIANSRATLATLPGRARRRAVVAAPGLPEIAPRTPRPAGETCTMGLVGRIAPTKGQDVFVAAGRIASARRPRLRFRIIGAPIFGEQAYARGVHDAVGRAPAGLVTIEGWSDDPAQVMASLDVLIHASPVPEPFGQVVTEAMGIGVPVIATRAGGVVDIVDPEGEAEEIIAGVWRAPRGLLVSPGDPAALARAIMLAHDDPALMRRCAANAAADVRERWGIAATAAIVTDVWEAAAARR